jgi:hypothetical protein
MYKIEQRPGNHINVAVPNFAAMFEFFAAHRKTAATPLQR